MVFLNSKHYNVYTAQKIYKTKLKEYSKAQRCGRKGLGIYVYFVLLILGLQGLAYYSNCKISGPLVLRKETLMWLLYRFSNKLKWVQNVVLSQFKISPKTNCTICLSNNPDISICYIFIFLVKDFILRLPLDWGWRYEV